MTGIYLKLFWYKGFVPEKHCLIRLGQCKSTQYNQFEKATRITAEEGKNSESQEKRQLKE